MDEATPELKGATVMRVSEEVLRRTAGTETVLLDLDSEEFFGLDGVGARVFELFEEPRSFDDVIETVHAEYDVDRDTLRADLTDLATELVTRKLLVIVDD